MDIYSIDFYSRLYFILNPRSYVMRKNERGNILVLTAALMVVVIGIAALALDVSIAQNTYTRMQTAADAAALAGAKQLPYEIDARAAALNLCRINGYVDGENGVVITCTRNPDGAHPGWYQVEIAKPITMYFGGVFHESGSMIRVHATAAFVSPLPMYISGSLGEYGVNGIQNLSCFGPYGRFSYGDAYSTYYLNNGDDNPYYQPEGYNFLVDIGSDYFSKNGTNQIEFQVFDPDTWNVGNAKNSGPGKVDEIRSGTNNPGSDYTTTRFQLYAPDSTPSTFDDDMLIAEAEWGPGDNWSDMQWVTPEGWAFSLSEYGYGKYRINIQTIGGSSENGFNLRAGAPDSLNEDNWDPNNGTEITAVGTLPINFSQDGQVDVDLGYIPPEAAGYNVYINKFDTDVGAKSITYYDDYGNSWPGELAGNGTFKVDVIEIPQGYGGGRLYAQYRAGRQDTSSWQLYFDGQLEDLPGELRLVD
jgi:hypothetical protein